MIYQTTTKVGGCFIIEWVFSCGACTFRTVEPKRQKAVTVGQSHVKSAHPNAKEQEEVREVVT